MSNRNAASLTGSLLVRKGAAAPSPLGRGAGFEAPPPSRFTPKLAPRPSPVAAWAANDKPAAAAAKKDKPAVTARENRKRGPAPAPAGSPDGEPSQVRRFTLRLSRDQHLRMRLASVHLGRSGQKLLLEALDEYLDRIAPELREGDCACILDGVVAPPPMRGGEKSA